MTWTKLSDDYSDDCWTLSDAAFRLHTEGLIWSNRKLLDNVIPRDDLRRFAHDPSAVDELLDVGWWSEVDGCLVIRHHAGYQLTRERVLRRQATSAANGRKGGRPAKARERSGTQSETQPLTQPETYADGTGRDGKGSSTEGTEARWGDVPEHLRTPENVVQMPRSS